MPAAAEGEREEQRKGAPRECLGARPTAHARRDRSDPLR